MTDFAPTGDGTMAALQVLSALIKSGKPASEVLNLFDPVPQKLKNVRYIGPSPLDNPSIISAIRDAESDLATTGRILVRASGTEPVIRIMAECDDVSSVERVTNDLAALIEAHAA